MPANYFTATQWRERARRTRAAIDQEDDPSVRRKMVSIAEAYDRLANHAEARGSKRVSVRRA